MLVTLGMLGGILFFPVQLGNDYTCLYHRLVYSDHPGTHHYHADETTVPAIGKSQSPGIVDAKSDRVQEMDQHSEPLKFYLRKFAPFWWASLFIIFIGYIVFTRGIGKKKRRNRISRPTDPGQTAKL